MTNTVETFGSDYALQLDLTKDKAVIIKNNDYLYSEYPNLMWFADMLARTDSSEKALDYMVKGTSNSKGYKRN